MLKIENEGMDGMQFERLLRKSENKLLKSFEDLIKIGKFGAADLYAHAFGIEKDARKKIIKNAYNSSLNFINSIIEKEPANNFKISEINEKLKFSKDLSKYYAFLDREKLDQTMNGVFNFFYEQRDYLEACNSASNPELSRKAFAEYSKKILNRLS
ncbi:MAG: hypothetical protein M1331_00150 [Candidatus Marsarchaeota archaeon]|nr:hypothetical protein [Candidatus Marsarchaeota archaeon]